MVPFFGSTSRNALLDGLSTVGPYGRAKPSSGLYKSIYFHDCITDQCGLRTNIV